MACLTGLSAVSARLQTPNGGVGYAGGQTAVQRDLERLEIGLTCGTRR